MLSNTTRVQDPKLGYNLKCGRLTCTLQGWTWHHRCSGKTSPLVQEQRRRSHLVKHSCGLNGQPTILRSYSSLFTLKSCTPMHANMNCSSVVTIMMLPMVLMATKTHWTTCCKTAERHTHTLVTSSAQSVKTWTVSSAQLSGD